MGIYTKKTLTKREEARQKSDRIGNDVMQLSFGKSKEIQQERMGRKRKPPIDVGEEKHPFIGPRARLDLTWAREATPIARDQSIVLVTMDVLRRNNGRQPVPADIASRRSVRRKPAGTSAPGGSPE